MNARSRRYAQQRDVDGHSLAPDAPTSRPRHHPIETALVRPTSGQGLDPAARGFLEDRFRHDLSHVRVHDDGEAERLTDAVQARAFTSGHDIFFQQGAYDPGSVEGLHLLAHEAAHTIQQDVGPVATIAGPSGARVSDPADAFEQTARRAATQAVLGLADPSAPRGSISVLPSTASRNGGVSEHGTAVQREDEDRPFWESGIFHALSGAAGLLPGPAGGAAKLLRHPFQMAEGMTDAAEGDTLGAVQGIGGALTSVASGVAGLSGFSALGAGGLGGLVSNLGALGTVGGLGADAGLTMAASSAVTGGGLSGAAALGPAALVAAAGLGGLGIGTAIAENTQIDEGIGDAMFDVLGPEPGLWLADTFGL